MPIRRDLGGLPVAKPEPRQGWAPDPEPTFGRLIVDAWLDKQEHLPRSRPEARFRHSDAAGCSRAIAYSALDLEPSDPLDAPGAFVIEMGHIIHQAWQDQLVQRYGPRAEVEVTCGEDETAGHIDAIVRIPDEVEHVPDCYAIEPGRFCNCPDTERVIAIEGKSVGGYAYQLAVGAKGQPQGPRWSAVVQAALNAHYVGADEAKVIYWARDAISVQMAERKQIPDIGRVCAEWTLPADMFEPIALKEIERVTAIMALLDEGTLPARKIPDPELPARHLIVDPSTGTWVEMAPNSPSDQVTQLRVPSPQQVVDTGTTWHCVYCRYQTFCATTPAGRCSINDLNNMEEDSE